MSNKTEARLLYCFVFSIPLFDSFFLGLFVSYFSALSSFFSILLFIWSYKKLKFNEKEFLLLLTLLSILIANVFLSLSFNPINLNQFKRIFHIAYLYVISYFLYRLFSGSGRDNLVKATKKAMLHGVAFCFIFSLFEYLVFKTDVIGFEFYLPFDLVFHALRPSWAYDNEKLRSVAAEANYLGMFLAFALPLISTRHIKSTAILFAFTFMLIFMTYNSQSRFTLVAISLYILFKLLSRFRYLIFPLIALVSIFLYFGIAENYILKSIISDNSLSIRLGITLSELNIFAHNPIVGVGLGNVNIYIEKFTNALTNSSTDLNVFLEGGRENILVSFNIFSQLLAEIGIFALLFIAAILYPFIYYPRVSIDDRWILESYAMTVIAMLNFSTIHFYAFPLMIGMSYALIKKNG